MQQQKLRFGLGEKEHFESCTNSKESLHPERHLAIGFDLPCAGSPEVEVSFLSSPLLSSHSTAWFGRTRCRHWGPSSGWRRLASSRPPDEQVAMECDKLPLCASHRSPGQEACGSVLCTHVCLSEATLLQIVSPAISCLPWPIATTGWRSGEVTGPLVAENT